MSRIMAWLNYRRGPSLAVPAPFDDNSSPYWWYDRIASMFQHLAGRGVTEDLFPGSLMTQSGAYRTGDGYGVYNDYDLGTASAPTRFGSADQLRRAVAIAHANGQNVLLDHIMHQRMGGRAGVYRYAASSGAQAGRFPKDPPCFRGSPPRVPEDPVPSPPDDFSFGDELCPVNAQPKDYVWNGLLDAGDWLFRATGADGARLDDMKGLNVDFMKAWMSHGAMKGKWFFGEYASGNPNDTNWWVGQVDDLASATDFGAHYNAIQPLCNDSSYAMSRLGNNWNTMFQSNPMHAVPFVESMDSDTNGFATIMFNKELGYAYLMTNEGLPCIYIRDYLSEPDCYGLGEPIDNLCWAAQVLCNGATVTRWADPHVFAYERMGDPGAVIALNNDFFNPAWHTITVQTHFGPNVELHDHTGHNQSNCWTDGQGRATFGVPPGGPKGYGIWAPASYWGKAIPAPKSRSTTQDFEGAPDLQTPPLGNTMSLVGRVWCDKATPISCLMQGAAADGCAMQIIQPDTTTLAHGRSDHVYGTTKQRGWHQIYAQQVVQSTPMPFVLSVTYTGTKDLQISEYGL